jgi:hypothetical protein
MSELRSFMYVPDEQPKTLESLKGFKIVNYESVKEDLKQYHSLGAKKGVYLGFSNMEEYYSMKTNGVTDWTGYPQSGKTQLLLECLFNTSKFYGWKHLIYAPDIGDYLEILEILIHMETGKSFNKNYMNYISLEEIFQSCKFIFEHFFIIEVDPSQPFSTLTPVDFWNYAVEMKKTHGIQTATIDSWKDMYHDYSKYGGSYAQYLSNVLPIRNKLAEVNDIHFHTVIHPKSPVRNSKGELVVPDVDSMEGGAQWNNSGKSIICVHRASIDTKTADVKILKAKPKIVGKRGFFCLEFDVIECRYFQLNMAGEREYAKKEFSAFTQLSNMQPQSDFDSQRSIYPSEPPF